MALFAGVRNWGALRWTIAILSCVYAVVFVGMLVAHNAYGFIKKEPYEAFFNLYQAIPPFFGGLCSIVLASKWRHGRRSMQIGWLLIGLGCLSFFVGQSTWFYLETLKHLDPMPIPSWADAGYFGSYPFLIAGMLLLFRSTAAVGRGRTLLDGAIAASALGTVSWYFMISDVWNAGLKDPNITPLGRLSSVAYPLGDLALIFMAIIAFNSFQKDRAGRKSMALVGAGLVLISFSDTYYTYTNLQGTYNTGSWFDWGWSFGWLCLSFALLNRLWNKPTEQVEIQPKQRVTKGWFLTVRAFAPYIASGVAVGITLGHDYWKDHKIDSTHNEIIFLGALIVVRQIFMLVENVGLTRRIAAVNDDLERRVEERTRQISGIQALTRDVNLTLDIDSVAEQAAQHSIGLLHADAFAIWLWRSPTESRAPIPLRVSLGFEATRSSSIASLQRSTSREMAPSP